MKGSDYVAKVRLTDAAGKVVAAVGETCERVNPGSLHWLERDGLIERVRKAKAPKED